MAAPGTLFGYSEPQVAGAALVGGVAAIVFLKLALIRYLVRSQKVGRTGTAVLYAVLALSVASILAIVLLLFYWKA